MLVHLHRAAIHHSASVHSRQIISAPDRARRGRADYDTFTSHASIGFPPRASPRRELNGSSRRQRPGSGAINRDIHGAVERAGGRYGF